MYVNYFKLIYVLRTSLLLKDNKFMVMAERSCDVIAYTNKAMCAARSMLLRAEATDADKAATARVVDLPRISPGPGR